MTTRNVKEPKWDKSDSISATANCDAPFMPPYNLVPGMTVTASLSGKQVKIQITTVHKYGLFEGIVDGIDIRNTTHIEIEIGDSVQITIQEIFHINGTIR